MSHSERLHGIQHADDRTLALCDAIGDGASLDMRHELGEILEGLGFAAIPGATEKDMDTFIEDAFQASLKLYDLIGETPAKLEVRALLDQLIVDIKLVRRQN